MKAYEEKPALPDVYAKLAEAEAEIQEGRTMDALAALEALRAKYGV